MEKIKNFILKIRNMFKHHCPDCNGIMDSEFLDMEFDKLVYKCSCCGKEWI